MASLVFDIGANQGEWTRHNLQAGLAKKIISIEASPTTFNTLRNRLNQYENVELMNAAVHITPGVVKFFNSPIHTLSTTNKEWLTSPDSRFCGTGFQEIIVPTVTLDTLISTHGIPDLIKIDVEGGEFETIRSLTQKVPLLCFEWASEVNPISFKCVDYLETLGFTKFFIQFQDDYTFRPNPTDYVLSVDDVKRVLSSTVPKQHWGMIWCA